jgi:hypothetical protein
LYEAVCTSAVEEGLRDRECITDGASGLRLVRQQSEKFVLASVGFLQGGFALAQRVLKPYPLDEIACLTAIDLQASHFRLRGPVRRWKMC